MMSEYFTYTIVQSCPVENHAEQHSLPESLADLPSSKS